MRMTCTQCGKTFYRQPNRVKYSKIGLSFCSRQCYADYRHEHLDWAPNATCHHCKKPIHVSPCYLKRFTRHYCDRACQTLGRGTGPAPVEATV